MTTPLPRSAAAQAALDAAADPTKSMYEVLFCVPTQQKCAKFVRQRQRFAAYAHAKLFVEMHVGIPPLGTFLGVWKGTLAEIDALRGLIEYGELIDLVDDYDGVDYVDCEWEVLRMIKPKKKGSPPQFEPLGGDEDGDRFTSPSLEKAEMTRDFIIEHCPMAGPPGSLVAAVHVDGTSFAVKEVPDRNKESK